MSEAAAIGEIITVRGAVPVADVGITLPHEHLYIQLWEIRGRFDGAHQLEDDVVFCSELDAFRKLGGTCLVDLTLPAIGRQPDRLRRLAITTGVHIVMGCGWYREPYYPPEDRIDRRDVAALAEILVNEIRVGFGPEHIQPGVIGEIGVDKNYISAAEERVHRAAARAQRETGLSIATHGLFSDVGLRQLNLLEEAGADPRRIAIGHCDSYPHLDYLRSIAERGAYVMLDNIGDQFGEHEARVARLVAELIDAGHLEKILLSHDVCKMPQLRYHGGRGFTYLFEHFVPRLSSLGVCEEAIRTITSDNPRRWLSHVRTPS